MSTFSNIARVFTPRSATISALIPGLSGALLEDFDLKENLFRELHCSGLLPPSSTSSTISNDEKDSLRPIFDDYYWPLYCYVKDRYTTFHSNRSTSAPFVIGLSAPQGCGKTTVTNILTLFFRKDESIQSKIQSEHKPVNCIAVSLDDFYLTGVEQENLAKQQQHNPLLQFRGNAGTHDMTLIRSTLDNIIKFNKRQATSLSSASESLLRIPRYSKVLRDGRGDRLPIQSWTQVADPVDIVLFEGWMLGFSAFPYHIQDNSESSSLVATTLEQRITELKSSSDPRVADFSFRLVGDSAQKCFNDVNDLLKSYQFLHDEYINDWIVLALEDTSAAVVHRWRLQAEHHARAELLKNSTVVDPNNKIGLSDDEVYDFVARFMPAYQLYLPYLYQYGPYLSKERPPSDIPQILKIIVNDSRSPVGFQVMK